MNKYEKCCRSVSGLALGALVLASTGIAPASAAEAEAETLITAQTSEASAAANQVLALDDFQVTEAGHLSSDGSVAVESGTVSMDLGSATGLVLDLPVGTGIEPQISDDGTLVYADESNGLHTEVQSVEDGPARILTVAEESFSDKSLHEYGYGVQLPAGMELTQLTDGTVVVLQDLDSAPAAEPVDLSVVLPEVSEVDAVDYQENQAPLEVIGAAGDAALEGKAIAVAFQEPWSVDSEGNELPTHFEVRGSELVQVVDTTDAAFPVVSDPLPLIAIALGAAARAVAPHAIRAFAATTIRAGVAYTTKGGYATFARFKAAAGSRSGYQWHHIVEQSTLTGTKRGVWKAEAIHHKNNLVQIPTQVHQKCINSWMSRKGVRSLGANAASNQTMRQWVHQQSFSTQHQIGVNLLRHCGVNI
ncbi:hypothetical protein [Arthrobacter antioxidans]|uniref:hypothetical protein n=1 Tax=Arthrobacter antioxidans TaxID=2895818 RepID=UPI001FFE2E44|nr:hypothetical protein [Arthrobacter antioxidans]